MPKRTFVEHESPLFGEHTEDSREFDRTTDGADEEWASFELSARRTGMSFQRTRLSADRTLMSVIRTALSLITFGFTTYQAFQHLHRAELLHASESPRRFGAALVSLGVAMLVVGIGYQVTFMRGLRRERRRMKAAGFLHADSQYPISLSLVVAVLLLALGAIAFVSILFDVGPLG